MNSDRKGPQKRGGETGQMGERIGGGKMDSVGRGGNRHGNQGQGKSMVNFDDKSHQKGRCSG